MASDGPSENEQLRREVHAETPRVPAYRDDQERSLRVVTGGSITEAVGGIGAVVLAILGLAGVLPGYMAAVATIAVGVALLAQGGAAAARFSRIVEEARSYRTNSRAELGGGVGAELFGGAVGVVLGILALLGLDVLLLVPIALIVFGGALLLGSGITVELSAPSGEPLERAARTTREATMAASGMQVLVGIGAIVLGIIALVGMSPLTTSLVGLLAVGCSVLFSGSAVSSRMMSLLRH